MPDYIPRRFTEYDTIEKLFGIIEKSISPKPDKLFVKYNEYHGYPEKFELDKTLSGNDDELEFEVLELYAD